MSDSEITVPGELVRLLSGQVPAPGMPAAADWLERLPALAAEVLADWQLVRDGPAGHGCSALVLPVRSARGPAVLKIVRPHPGGREEHRALRLWNGHGAVRLLAADPARWALLLERLDVGRTLETEALGSALGELTATEELGALVRVLDRPAPPWAPTLSQQLRSLLGELESTQPAPSAFPRRMLEEARTVATDLLGESGLDARLTHDRLHQGHALWRPEPGQWVAIGAEVVAAEPGWAFEPALLGAWAALERASSVRRALRTRLEILADVSGVPLERAQALTLVRLVRDALRELASGEVDHRRVTRLVTVAKALQGD